MLKRWWVPSSLALLLVASCGQPRSAQPNVDDEVVKAPFDARVADFTLHMPERVDLNQAHYMGGKVYVRLCLRRPATRPVPPPNCGALSEPLINEEGVSVIVWEPSSNAPFKFLKERPGAKAAPPTTPLVPLKLPVDGVSNMPNSFEAYFIGRTSNLGGSQLLTTTVGWPIAACSARFTRSRHCMIGFLINGAAIEARFFAEEGAELNQREVWQVASEVDAKLRSLIVETAEQNAQQAPTAR